MKIQEILSRKVDATDAVNALKTQLEKLASQPNPDLTYDNIDRIMRRICDSHYCKAHDLHDLFISYHNATPDQWVKDLVDKE